MAPLVRFAVTSATGEFERAVILHRAGWRDKAEALCRAVLARSPDDARALHLLGTIRFASGHLAEAIALLERALAAKPDYAEAAFNLGAMFAQAGRLEDAAASYGRAASLQADHAESWARQAAVLMNLRREAEAEAAYRHVVVLQPDHAAAHTDLAALAATRGDLDAAVHHARRAVALAPQEPMAFLRLGRALDEAGEQDEAMAQFRQALRLAPDPVEHHRNILRALLYAPQMTEAARAAQHHSFGAAMAARVERALPAPSNDRDPDRRLRVGWLTSDVRQHPVGRNIEPLFAARDTSRFAFICYAEVERPDDMTEWFRRRSDAWRSTVGLSDGAVAEQIRADGIDVMIYLAGRFDHNRPQVAAWRPAPVQVSFHDPATSGLAEMDYLIADPVLVPRRTTEWFSERVVRLPHFYMHRPLLGTPDIRPPPMAMAGHVTFGCFNNPAKIGRPTLDLWRRLLEALPAARLKLKYHARYGSLRLQSRIQEALGPRAAARVEFGPGSRTIGEHLHLYNDIDVALDPFPFTGSTTTFEALWMGVPVVTLLGHTMVGRWSASMLHAVQLDGLIARTPDDYVALASRLAADQPGLMALRAALRERLVRSPLCEGARSARHFERLIQALWRRWCRVG